MKTGDIINLILGIALTGYAILHFIEGIVFWAFIKLLIGSGLVTITFVKNRYGQVIFGHITIVAGCMLLTSGILMVPLLAEAIQANGNRIPLSYIFGTPLFWGLFAIFGGICATYHGFCRCISGRKTPLPIPDTSGNNADPNPDCRFKK